MNKILFICSGHQDNETKLDYVVNNLKKLSHLNLDICYASHTDYGVDRITKLCKYFIYDKDNLFPNESNLFDNLEFIPEDKFKFSLTSYYTLPFGRLNNRLFLTHSRSALSILKNSIYLAKANNYEWIVYFEYDAVLPDTNLLEYFSDKINHLNNNNLDGDFYHCEGDRYPLIWPHFFVCKTNLFMDDKDFISDFSTPDNFVKLYANQFFEQILTEMFSNKENISVRSSNEIVNDFNLYGYDQSTICDQGVMSKFSLGDKEKDQNEKNLNSSSNHHPWFIEIYPKVLSEDEYQVLLVIYSGNTSKYESFRLDYLDITNDQGQSLIKLENVDLHIGNWQSFDVIHNYKIKEEEQNIFIKYCINKINVGKVNVNYKLNLNQLNKYKNIRFLE